MYTLGFGVKDHKCFYGAKTKHTLTNKRQKKISCKPDLCPIGASFEVAQNAMTWLNYFLKVTRIICPV